jgi:uncharacterized secreted repeat protein (TIGR03808 family)
MAIDRRSVLFGTAAAVVAGASTAPARPAPQPISSLGLEATTLGVRPGSPDDQSAALQKAIVRATSSRVPLALAPGVYRVGAIELPSGAALVAPRGACRLVLSGTGALASAENADTVTLSGLVFDGQRRPLPERRGLLSFTNTRGLRISDCEIVNAGGHGITLVAASGDISDNTVAGVEDVAILSYDANGLMIAKNAIRDAGNNGIQLIRSTPGDDGTQVLDNRIEDVGNRAGGSGQYGNAINAHRGANVTVRGNHIRRCAFSGVRGNAAANIQIVGNTISDMGEVAIYAEFGFVGAVIAHNSIDGAQTGISVANYNEGGRLAVVQGNIVRNLARRSANPSPDGFNGIGIHVEADTAVNGNVVENAGAAGIALGWGRYLRDVAVTGNIVRMASIGVAVSVVEGSGSALIADNVIARYAIGAIVGMDHAKPVTGDLTKAGAARFPHVLIGSNHAS